MAWGNEEVSFNGGEDVTTPEQRAVNAEIRAKTLMERFAHQWAAVSRSIELELRTMDLVQLAAFEVHINALSTTNCWWAEYEIRQTVMDEVKRCRHQLERKQP